MFDKTFFQAFRAEMQAAMDTIAARHGIRLQMKGIKYDDAGFRFQTEAKSVDKSGIPVLSENDACGVLLLIDRTDIPTPVLRELRLQHAGKTYAIIGVNNRARSKPIELLEIGTGKRARCDTHFVAARLTHIPMPDKVLFPGGSINLTLKSPQQ